MKSNLSSTLCTVYCETLVLHISVIFTILLEAIVQLQDGLLSLSDANNLHEQSQNLMFFR